MRSTFHYYYIDFFYDFLHAIKTSSSRNQDGFPAEKDSMLYTQSNTHLSMISKAFCCIFELDPTLHTVSACPVEGLPSM